MLQQAPIVERTEDVELDALQGRILRAALTAPVSLPPFANSAMDGYALASGHLAGEPPYRLPIIGASLAGHPYPGTVGARQCIRITTGAALPEGADAVVIQENCEVDDQHLTIRVPVSAGQHIRQPGHDISAGNLLAPAGHRVTPFDIGWLAACGITSARVFGRTRTAIFSTGDELRIPGTGLAAGQIYDSNRFALRALLTHLPTAVTDLGILPDEPNEIRRALVRASEDHELLMTSGGVSVGDADYLKEVVEEVGHLGLWKLNLKPGKPLAFGSIGRAMFIGLPGNPVSSIVTYLLIARQVLLKMGGATTFSPTTFKATLEAPIRHAPGREEYQRGITRHSENGVRVQVSGDQSSNRLATFSGADCLIRVPKNAGDLEAGTEVDVLPFEGMIS